MESPSSKQDNTLRPAAAHAVCGGLPALTMPVCTHTSHLAQSDWLLQLCFARPSHEAVPPMVQQQTFAYCTDG